MVGVTGAIIGSAIIGAGATMLGSSAQKKAANKAADASQYGYDLQYQLGQDSLALNQGIYNQNYALGSPFVANGLGASNALMSMLGVSPAAIPANALASGATGTPQTNPVAGQAPVSGSGASLFSPQGLAALQAAGLGGGEPIGLPTMGPGSINSANGSVAGAGAATIGARPRLADYRGDVQGWRNALQGWRAGTPTAPGGTAAAGGVTGQNAAFNNFKNSAGFDFAMDTMADAVNNRYAAAGALQSGAAMKAIQDRASDVAIQGYLMPYMGMLSGIQNMGAGMGSSVMGVGTNFGNTAANINSNIAGAAGANAANLGNIYQQQGANQANMWSNLGSSFGTALGGLSGGGFGGGGGISAGGGSGLYPGYLYPGI